MLSEEASEARGVFLALQLTFPANCWGPCASAAMERGQKPFTTAQGAAALTLTVCPGNNTQRVQSIIIQLHIRPARRLIICFPCFTVERAEAQRDGESWRRTGNKCQSSLVHSLVHSFHSLSTSAIYFINHQKLACYTKDSPN